MYKEEGDWMRHNETQRGSLTTILIAVYGALIAFLPKDRPLNATDWPSPALMIILGLVGFLAVLKYWERFMFHTSVSDKFREELESNGARTDAVWKQGRAKHCESKPWLSDPFMQHYIWLSLHALVIVVGIIVLVAAFAGGTKVSAVTAGH
jgi:hypothetical protein